jgi:hypothetical protein
MFSTDIPLESRIENKNHGKIPEYNINIVFFAYDENTQNVEMIKTPRHEMYRS